jgi:hypothetical protein
MEQGLIWNPEFDHHTESPGVALANEMLANHDGAGREIGYFLTRLTRWGKWCSN